MTDELLAGRYRRIAALGHGAMGEVWLADDLVLGRKVAIKRLRADPSAGVDQAGVDRMVREARTAARLHHRNIVTVFDLVSVDGQPHVVMEYVAGESLGERIRRTGRLSVGEARRVAAQLAAGLEAAHRAEVVHRDVKPANIMLEHDGEAKLADFGIARGLGDAALTDTGQMVGTIAYMAPEVARTGNASAASDVWSLGATLFAAVEGRAPHDDGSKPNTTQMLIRLVTEPVPAPTHAAELAPLIMAMLSADPADRPTAGEIVRRLAVLPAEQLADDAESLDEGRVEEPDVEEPDVEEPEPTVRRSSPPATDAAVGADPEPEEPPLEITRRRADLAVVERAEPVGEVARDDSGESADEPTHRRPVAADRATDEVAVSARAVGDTALVAARARPRTPQASRTGAATGNRAGRPRGRAAAIVVSAATVCASAIVAVTLGTRSAPAAPGHGASAAARTHVAGEKTPVAGRVWTVSAAASAASVLHSVLLASKQRRFDGSGPMTRRSDGSGDASYTGSGTDIESVAAQLHRGVLTVKVFSYRTIAADDIFDVYVDLDGNPATGPTCGNRADGASLDIAVNPAIHRNVVTAYGTANNCPAQSAILSSKHIVSVSEHGVVIQIRIDLGRFRLHGRSLGLAVEATSQTDWGPAPADDCPQVGDGPMEVRY